MHGVFFAGDFDAPTLATLRKPPVPSTGAKQSSMVPTSFQPTEEDIYDGVDMEAPSGFSSHDQTMNTSPLDPKSCKFDKSVKLYIQFPFFTMKDR